MTRFGGVALGLLIMTTTSLANAGDTAAAQALFSEGRKLMTQGKYAEACPKLEESENLDPGTGTLYNVGDCDEHLGKTASAWAAFDEVASEARAAGQPARERDARARADKLLPQLAHLTIDASNVKNLAGVRVTRNGTNVGSAEWSLAIPVDPGDRVIGAGATGKKDWTATVKIAPHESKTVTIPALEDLPADAAPIFGDGSRDETRSDGKTQRTIGLIVAGVGVAALATGVVLTFVSKGEESKSNDGDCNASTNVCKTSEGISERNTALLEGNLSTVGIIAGVVLAGGGIALWATAPKAHPKTSAGKWSVAPDFAFDPRGASLGLRGRW